MLSQFVVNKGLISVIFYVLKKYIFFKNIIANNRLSNTNTFS